jgi:hypothetical protein
MGFACSSLMPAQFPVAVPSHVTNPQNANWEAIPPQQTSN